MSTTIFSQQFFFVSFSLSRTENFMCRLPIFYKIFTNVWLSNDSLCFFISFVAKYLWWKVSVSKNKPKWFSSSSKFVKYSFQFSTIAYISLDCIFRSTNVYTLLGFSPSWNWIEFTRFPLELYYLDWVQFYVKLSWIFWFCCCGGSRWWWWGGGMDWIKGWSFEFYGSFFFKVSFPLYIESISN